MALATNLRVVTAVTWVVAGAGTFVASTAGAEGLSLGLGASTTSAPNGDSTSAAPPPPPSDAPSVGPPASPSPAADTPPPDDSPSSQLPNKNPSNYEFAIVSVAAYQTWAIAGNVLYFGIGGGVGPPLYRYGKLGSTNASDQTGVSHKAGWDPTLDIVYANAFLRVTPFKNLDLDVGPKIALGGALYNVNDAPQTAFSYGGYVDLRVGSERVKVGPRFEYDRIAYSNYYENGWRLTPLMLRIVH